MKGSEDDGHQGVDQDVIERAKAGDPASFEILIHHYDRGLRTLAYRMLEDSSADDVLQDAYLKAYRALPNFRTGEGSVGAWFHRIVYRTCIDHLRGVRRDAGLLIEESDNQPSSLNPFDELVAQRMDLVAALQRLSPEDRACVVLVDVLGFDYQATATVLAVPRGTVASRLNHARGVLRKALDITSNTTREDD
ncbi:MAG: RNA polymerase sigma factor [Actinobacteria bacterium]|nr:RNA polymerase sigma factor [Actinomycetota bacterium]